MGKTIRGLKGKKKGEFSSAGRNPIAVAMGLRYGRQMTTHGDSRSRRESNRTGKSSWRGDE